MTIRPRSDRSTPTHPARTGPPLFRLGRRWRTFVVTVHAASGVGWLGVHASVLVLVATAASAAPDAASAPLAAAAILVRTLVLPVSLLAVASGLVLSLGTRWGMLRHYWVAGKLVLSTALLLGSNLSIGPQVVEIAATATTPGVDVAVSDVVRTAVALAVSGAVLLTVTVLSTTKPFGLVRRYWTAGRGPGSRP